MIKWSQILLTGSWRPCEELGRWGDLLVKHFPSGWYVCYGVDRRDALIMDKHYFHPVAGPFGTDTEAKSAYEVIYGGRTDD